MVSGGHHDTSAARPALWLGEASQQPQLHGTVDQPYACNDVRVVPLDGWRVRGQPRGNFANDSTDMVTPLSDSMTLVGQQSAAKLCTDDSPEGGLQYRELHGNSLYTARAGYTRAGSPTLDQSTKARHESRALSGHAVCVS